MIAALILGSLLVSGVQSNIRWTIYLLIVPFAVTVLFQFRSSLILCLALFGPLILFESSLISMRFVGPLSVGLSLPLLAILLTRVWHLGRSYC